MSSHRTFLLLVLLVVVGTVMSRPFALALVPSGTVYAADGAPTYGFEFGEKGQVLYRFIGGCFISPIPVGAVTQVDVSKKVAVDGEDYAPITGSITTYVRLADARTKP